MKTIGLAFAAAALAFAAPSAMAQEYPVVPGDFVEISMIKVDDGHDLEYANHLAGTWRKGQDFAKSQGWITDYQIWTNVNAREDEADVYLVTWFPRMETPQEVDARSKAYNAHLQTTIAKAQSDSGKRATYRKLAGSMLLRNQSWRK